MNRFAWMLVLLSGFCFGEKNEFISKAPSRNWMFRLPKNMDGVKEGMILQCDPYKEGVVSNCIYVDPPNKEVWKDSKKADWQDSNSIYPVHPVVTDKEACGQNDCGKEN